MKQEKKLASDSSWEKVDIFHRGDDFYQSLLADIRRARVSIALETYIFAVDRMTQLLLEEMGQARKRGCRVQLLVDGFGSYYWLPALNRLCLDKKIALRVYHPLPQSFAWFRHFFFVYFFALRTWQLVRRLNNRNHRKTAIIDGEIAYLGSLNYTQLHSESIMGTKAWRDSGVRVQGSGVQTLSYAFVKTWQQAARKGLARILKFEKKRTRPHVHPLVRLNSTQRLRFHLYRDLIRRIKNAEKNVSVVTAYFVPKRSLIRALKSASRRGVSVELILPGITDVPIVRWATFELVNTLLKSGVKIYEYQNRVLHAKYMLIDNYCSIGSLNLNHRSFLHDLEVEVVLDGENQIAEMRKQWQIDRQLSLPLTEEKLRQTRWYMRVLSRIAFRIRYLL